MSYFSISTHVNKVIKAVIYKNLLTVKANLFYNHHFYIQQITHTLVNFVLAFSVKSASYTPDFMVNVILASPFPSLISSKFLPLVLKCFDCIYYLFDQCLFKDGFNVLYKIRKHSFRKC